jgi:hypothetical protein
MTSISSVPLNAHIGKKYTLDRYWTENMPTITESTVELVIPLNVEIVDDFLLSEAAMPNRREARPATLHDFIKLNPTDDNAICRYAQKWGTMGVCEQHQLPFSHAMNGQSTPRCYPPKVDRNGIQFYSEPLAFWRRCILKATALLRLGADIREGRNGRRVDWLTIAPATGDWDKAGWSTKHPPPWQHLPTARSLFASKIQGWLDVGGVRPRFSWDPRLKRWAIRHTTPSDVLWPLFGWLGIRLMIEVSGGRVTVCPYCQTEYFPQRLPGRNQDHCCGEPECKRSYFTAHKRKQRAGNA